MTSTQYARVWLYSFFICVVFVLYFASKQPPRVHPKEMCRRSHGTWVTREVMDVVTIYDGYNFTPMPQFRVEEYCEVHKRRLYEMD